MSRLRGFQQHLRTELTAEDGFTLSELLMVMVISSIIAGVVAAAMVVGVHSTTVTKSRFDESHDAQIAAAYFTADAGNAAAFSQAAPPLGSCAAGLTSIARFTWTTAAGTNDAFYTVLGSPPVLMRRSCVNDAFTSDVSLVKHLVSTPTVTCPAPATTCGSTPLDVQLNVQETALYGYSLRGVPRPGTGSGTSSAPKVAVYVGSGGMSLGGNHSTITQSGPDPGLVAVNGSATCHGAPADNIDGPLTVTSGSDCGGTIASPPADPLRNAVEPSATGLPLRIQAAALLNMTTHCGAPARPTFLPGHYAESSLSFNGACLDSGLYFLDHGGSMTDAASQTGGVLIYVPPSATDSAGANDLSIDASNHGSTNLQPLKSGTDPGITVFLGRKNTGTIRTQSTITVGGVVYAPAGELDLQDANANLTSGGIDVKTLQFGGNGGGIVVVQ